MTPKKQSHRLGSDEACPSDESKMVLGHNFYDCAAMVLFFAIVSIFIFTFRDYGYSWDEVTQNRWYGQAVLRFIQTFGEDTSALYTNNFYFYGGLFDAIAELIPHISPLDGFGARRFANVSLGLLALVGAWKTARLLSGPQAGFWALLFLIVTPAFYGHMFINAKDIPFAAGYIWSLYFILKSAESLPDISWGTAIGSGAAFGLAIGIRVGGALVIAYFFIMISLYLSSLLLNAKSEYNLERIKKGIFHKALLSLSIAWVMMVAFWPKVLVFPVRGLIEAFQATGHFKWAGDVLYHGISINAIDLPWHYLPVYFGVKLPIPILLIFVLGIVWSLMTIIKSVHRREWFSVTGPGLLVFAIIFPAVFAILTGAIVYDGIRHFLFIIPPMACLAGVVMVRLVAILEKRVRQLPLLLYSALGAYLVFHIWVMIQLHPYQYVFLNRLAGGIPSAATNFETDYWITSYREATMKMLGHAKEYAQREGIPFEERHFEVAVFGDVNIIRELVPENILVSKFDQRAADFYISSTRMGFDKRYPEWKTIDSVERMGMIFTVVKTSLPQLPGAKN